MNQLINHEAVYRTAPATPGLLIIEWISDKGDCKTAKNALGEGQSPPQELELSQHSGLYLLVIYTYLFKHLISLTELCFVQVKAWSSERVTSNLVEWGSLASIAEDMWWMKKKIQKCWSNAFIFP